MNSMTNATPAAKNKARILICDSFDSSGIDLLRQHTLVDDQTGINADQLAQIIDGYHGLVVRSRTKVTASLLVRAQKLKIIARAGVGTDNIDLAAARRQGIVVVNTPMATTTAVAEHTLALILALCRNLPQANTSVKAGEWEKKAFMGTELSGKTLGIIGVGRIGQAVAQRARAFNLHILGYDPFVAEDLILGLQIEPVNLEQLFSRSNVITIHTPLNEQTRGLINPPAIAAMKTGVLLISTARGGVIDEQALLDGLESGKIAGAALDVFDSEPPGLNGLIRHPNLIATPHIAAQTREAQECAAIQAAEEIISFLKGLPLRWQIR